MRLSTLVMEFLINNYIMIAFALFMGVLLFFTRKKLAIFGNIIEENISKEGIYYRVLLFMSAAFILWGYIFKTAFYSPYSTGVQGDNFNYLSCIIDNPSYYTARHVIFPWIGGQFIKIAKNIGILNPENRLFSFHAMTIASIPVHIFSIIGLVYLYKIFKVLQFSLAERVLGVLFLATTFGYWLWSIQPNSLGTALGLQCVALYYSIRMVKEENKALVFLAPFFIVMVIYAHIGAIFFAFTLNLFLGIYLLIYYRKNLWNIFIYVLTLLVTGVFFLKLSYSFFDMSLNGFGSVKTYIERLVETEQYGLVVVGTPQELFQRIANKIGVTVGNIFGLWVPQDAFDYIMIFMILATACALLLYIFSSFKKIYIISYGRNRSVMLMLLLTTIIPFIFFIFKTTISTHYYIMALVPNIVLLLMLTFMADRFYKKRFGIFLLCLIIPTSFLLNGFGSMNVLKGLDYRESEAYQKWDFLYQRYPSEKVFFFETYNEYEKPYKEVLGKKIYFFHDALTTVYTLKSFIDCFGSSFGKIEWIYPVYPEEILNKLTKTKDKVIIGPSVYAKIKNELPTHIKIDTLKDINSDNNFYLLHRDAHRRY